MNSIGGINGIGAPISNNQIGGENFIRHIGHDKLFYDFHEGNGMTIHDKSHCGHNGTLQGATKTPTWTRRSLYFDGGDAVKTDVVAHNIGTGNFTWLIRVKLDTAGHANQPKTLFSNGQYIPHLGAKAVTEQVHGYWTGHKYFTDFYPVEKWFDTVLRRTGTIWTSFIDLAKDATTWDKGTSMSNEVSYLGTDNAAMNQDFLFGFLQEIRVISRSLSEIEIQQSYLVNKFKN